MESDTVTINEHLGRRSQLMFDLTMSAFVASFFGFLQRWPLEVAIAWWALSLVALVAFIVVGARMARCPRCGSKPNPDADKCAACGVDFGDPMPPAG